jgi:hypothetical protein
MPEDNSNKAQDQDNEPYEEPLHTPPEIPLRPANTPEDTAQEQIPPVHAGHAPKSVIVRRLIMLLLGIILVGGGVAAAWKLIPSKKDDSQNNQSQQPPAEEPQTNQGIGDTALSETYKSDFLRLEFKYPGSWKVSEENSALTVKSPNFDFQDKTGMQTNGYFKVYIKRGTSDNDGKYLGNGYAVKPSEKFTYSEPATGQRTDTFLTDFGLETPDNFAYFVVQGNFNLKKGDTLGPKFANEPDSFLIAGGFAGGEQKDGLATQLLPLDSYKQDKAYITALEIVKTLQLN